MQAIEMRAQVTKKRELFLKLPDSAKSGSVKVIILYDDVPPPPMAKRRFGQFRGKIQISDDFDDTLPESLWTGEKS